MLYAERPVRWLSAPAYTNPLDGRNECNPRLDPRRVMMMRSTPTALALAQAVAMAVALAGQATLVQGASHRLERTTSPSLSHVGWSQ